VHIMSTNFAKTLVWKQDYDVKLSRHKQRTANTNDYPMPQNETPPMKIFCVRHWCHTVSAWTKSLHKIEVFPMYFLWFGLAYFLLVDISLKFPWVLVLAQLPKMEPKNNTHQLWESCFFSSEIWSLTSLALKWLS